MNYRNLGSTGVMVSTNTAHLAGGVHAGLFPLLPNGICRVLACDFEGNGWPLDALAHLDAVRVGRTQLSIKRGGDAPDGSRRGRSE
jgi:hypothetical protein